MLSVCQAPPSIGVLEYAADGTLIDGLGMLRRKGIDVGSWIAKKSTPKEVYLVISVDGTTVSLKASAEAVLVQKLPAKDVAVGFEPCAAPEMLNEHWPKSRVAATDAWHQSIAKGMIVQALASAVHSLDNPDIQVKVTVKPTKAVFATAPVKKGSLFFAPDADKLTKLVNVPSDKVSQPIVTLKSWLGTEQWALALSAPANAVSLCASVRTTDVKAKANMEWTHLRVTSAVVPDMPASEVLSNTNSISCKERARLVANQSPSCFHINVYNVVL